MNPRFRRARQIAAVALLSVVLAYVMMTVVQWAKFYKSVRPESFAHTNVALYKRKLRLTPEQQDHVYAILLSHKKIVNQIDQENLEHWKHLFASLSTASDEDLRRQLLAINELDARRNDYRLETLLKLRQEFNDEQKRQYGKFVVETVQKYIDMVLRIVR